ncbi:MAG: chromosome segregation protein SMC [Oscillospiraceae bacterium]|nr:chromosome segregation protein SMC [Oscillospiraceae bacterium]
MVLKSIDIQGFKSFPDKTSLVFGKGLTAVVGPNGSGKSNISDAVRWVLGETSAKTLRGTKKEDVIFDGTEKRRPQGFAVVSLTLDNKERRLAIDSDEVTITRKCYRSGESEYLINHNNVRLKDVQQLLMDTGLGKDGYSMVGQGRIAEIVDAKSNERREIFEEAAGISRFRYRKNEAEKQLSNAEENLIRLRDILSELESRVEPLRIQSEKAEKFLVLANERRELEISLWVENLEKSNQTLRDEDYKITALRTSYQEITDRREAISAQIEGVHSEMSRLAAEADELRRSIHTITEQIAAKDSQIAVFQNDISHNETSIAQLQEDLAGAASGDDAIDQEIADHREKQEQLACRMEETKAKISALESELNEILRESEGVSGDLLKIGEELSAATISASEKRAAAYSAEMNREELCRRSEELGGYIEKNTQKRTALEREQDDCNVLLNHTEEEISGILNSLEGYRMKLDSRTKKLEKAKAEAAEAERKCRDLNQQIRLLSDLEKNMEGYSESVKSVIRRGDQGALKGICGAISSLIDVESRYSVAIETALGGAMQNIVTETEENAKQAMNFLKENRIGRATFLPISAVKGKPFTFDGVRKEEGFIGLAVDLVRFDSRYNGVIGDQLGRIVIVDHIDTAIRISRKFDRKFRIVTLDGQVINAGGSMTGGSVSKSVGLLSRRNEIEKAQQRLAELTKEQEAVQEGVKAVQTEVSSLQAGVLGLEGSLNNLREEKIRYEGEKRRIDAELESCISTDRSLTAQREEADRKASQYRQEAATAKETEESLRAKVEELTAKRDALSENREAVSGKTESISAQISEKRLEEVTLQKDYEQHQLQIDQCVVRKKEMAERTSDITLRIDQLMAQSEAIGKQIDVVQSEKASLSREADNAETEIGAISTRRQALELSTTNLRADEQKCNDEREACGREISRMEEKKNALQTEYDKLIERLWTEYELTRSEAAAIAKPLESLTEANRRLSEIKSKIKGLGNVNVGAIEEYKEVSERYTFLSGQIADIERSRDELIKMIQELTAQMREMFLEGFHQINAAFKVVFTELFGGGKAELVLSEGEDVLSAGIDIHAQPPGKLVKNLTALSGGERGLIAVAIYFAILKVKPAPFCILDEIEAAFDDANVVRYAEYLQRMTRATQFICITHRRGTMEAADVLYGVTMQEEGVSKLLELQVSEVESRLGISGDKQENV